jgi:hypothetical protein
MSAAKFAVGQAVWFDYMNRSIINGEVAAVFNVGGFYFYNVRAFGIVYSNIGERRVGPRKVEQTA